MSYSRKMRSLEVNDTTNETLISVRWADGARATQEGRNEPFKRSGSVLEAPIEPSLIHAVQKPAPLTPRNPAASIPHVEIILSSRKRSLEWYHLHHCYPPASFQPLRVRVLQLISFLCYLKDSRRLPIKWTSIRQSSTFPPTTRKVFAGESISGGTWLPTSKKSVPSRFRKPGAAWLGPSRSLIRAAWAQSLVSSLSRCPSVSRIDWRLPVKGLSLVSFMTVCANCR